MTEVLIVDLQDKQVDAQFVQHVASHAARARDHGYTTVSIALVTDEHITELNKAHLGRARATDVLAYQGDADEPGYMGDVVVSTDAAARQAQEAGRPLLHEVAWLAAHGVLHLLGCDDATGPGRAEMFALQDTALTDVLGQRGRDSREEA